MRRTAVKDFKASRRKRQEKTLSIPQSRVVQLSKFQERWVALNMTTLITSSQTPFRNHPLPGMYLV
jgi:hypothetical protein